MSNSLLQNPYVIVFLLIIAWIFISQLIAWFILPYPKDEHSLANMSALVFISPAVLMLLLLSYANVKLKLWAQRRGISVKTPKDIEL